MFAKLAKDLSARLIITNIWIEKIAGQLLGKQLREWVELGEELVELVKERVKQPLEEKAETVEDLAREPAREFQQAKNSQNYLNLQKNY